MSNTDKKVNSIPHPKLEDNELTKYWDKLDERARQSVSNTDKIRDQIAKQIFGVVMNGARHANLEMVSDTWETLPEKFRPYYYKVANQILSIPGLWVESKNQTLPETPNYDSQLAKSGYEKAKVDVLQANFIKVEKKEVNSKDRI
jgi:hypothetical protein